MSSKRDFEISESTMTIEESSSITERAPFFEKYLRFKYRAAMERVMNTACDYDLFDKIKQACEKRPYYNLKYLMQLLKADHFYRMECHLEMSPIIIMGVLLQRVCGSTSDHFHNADYAFDMLQKVYGWPQIYASGVRSVIGSINSFTHPITLDQKIMHDIQLSRLGVSFGDFLDNQYRCSQECRLETTTQFFKNQRIVFGMLSIAQKSDDGLFHLSWFKRRYEENANLNVDAWLRILAKKINELQGGRDNGGAAMIKDAIASEDIASQVFAKVVSTENESYSG